MGGSRGRCQADYPDGRLIGIVRDPRGWYASARSHGHRYRDPDGALKQWRQGADEIAKAKREAPDRVFLMTYERLITEPEALTRRLAGWLGIDWTPSLLDPTFNRRPAAPNSSFEIPTGGIRAESLDRWRAELDGSELSTIDRFALPTYEAMGELAEIP